MKKVKILYIMPRCTKSGPIQVLSNILKHMDYTFFEIYVVTIEPENEKRTILKEFIKGFNYSYFNINKVVATLGYPRKLINYIKRINPDVIHSTGIVPDILINRFFKDKQLTIIHSNVYKDYYYLCGKVIGYLMAKTHVQVFRKASNVIACSKSLSDFYLRHDNLKVNFIRNGVELADQSIIKNNSSNLILKETKGAVFIYVASFNLRKNHKFLLEVFKNRAINDTLVLVGDGPTYNELNRLYKDCDNIFFIGRVSNVIPYLHASDFFISSSIQEGMPMGVLEAMSEGLPVLLSRIEQHEEILNLNSSVGMMFNNYDSDDLVSKIDAIKHMNYQRMVESAKGTVKKYFNSETMSKEYQNVYISMAEEHFE